MDIMPQRDCDFYGTIYMAGEMTTVFSDDFTEGINCFKIL